MKGIFLLICLNLISLSFLKNLREDVSKKEELIDFNFKEISEKNIVKILSEILENDKFGEFLHKIRDYVKQKGYTTKVASFATMNINNIIEKIKEIENLYKSRNYLKCLEESYNLFKNTFFPDFSLNN